MMISLMECWVQDGIGFILYLSTDQDKRQEAPFQGLTKADLRLATDSILQKKRAR